MSLETLLRNFTPSSLDKHPIKYLKWSSFYDQHRKSTLKHEFLKDPLVNFAGNEAQDSHMQKVAEKFKNKQNQKKDIYCQIIFKGFVYKYRFSNYRWSLFFLPAGNLLCVSKLVHFHPELKVFSSFRIRYSYGTKDPILLAQSRPLRN